MLQVIQDTLAFPDAELLRAYEVPLRIRVLGAMSEAEV